MAPRNRLISLRQAMVVLLIPVISTLALVRPMRNKQAATFDIFSETFAMHQRLRSLIIYDAAPLPRVTHVRQISNQFH